MYDLKTSFVFTSHKRCFMDNCILVYKFYYYLHYKCILAMNPFYFQHAYLPATDMLFRYTYMLLYKKSMCFLILVCYYDFPTMLGNVYEFDLSAHLSILSSGRLTVRLTNVVTNVNIRRFSCKLI